MKKYTINRPILALLSVLILTASAMAGPAPRFMMINGTMMELTPMASDVTLGNGCQVCTKCVIIGKDGKVTKLHNGDCVSADGVKMSPSALHLHGG